MGDIPLSTIIIAIAMLTFSVLIVSKIGGRILLSARLRVLLFVFGGAFLLAGLYLHLQETPATTPTNAKIGREERNAQPAFAFNFSPLQARWGEEVEIKVPFPGESVTVYLNGTPLPKRLADGGKTIKVTVPSGAKTGYLELEREGARASAVEPIQIRP